MYNAFLGTTRLGGGLFSALPRLEVRTRIYEHLSTIWLAALWITPV